MKQRRALPASSSARPGAGSTAARLGRARAATWPRPAAHHVWLVHDVQLADLAKVLVQHLHEAVDELQDRQLVLRGSGGRTGPSGPAAAAGRTAAGSCAAACCCPRSRAWPPLSAPAPGSGRPPGACAHGRAACCGSRWPAAASVQLWLLHTARAGPWLAGCGCPRRATPPSPTHLLRAHADHEEQAGVAPVDDLVLPVIEERALLVGPRQALAHNLALQRALLVRAQPLAEVLGQAGLPLLVDQDQERYHRASTGRPVKCARCAAPGGREGRALRCAARDQRRARVSSQRRGGVGLEVGLQGCKAFLRRGVSRCSWRGDVDSLVVLARHAMLSARCFCAWERRLHTQALRASRGAVQHAGGSLQTRQVDCTPRAALTTPKTSEHARIPLRARSEPLGCRAPPCAAHPDIAARSLRPHGAARHSAGMAHRGALRRLAGALRQACSSQGLLPDAAAPLLLPAAQQQAQQQRAQLWFLPSSLAAAAAGQRRALASSAPAGSSGAAAAGSPEEAGNSGSSSSSSSSTSTSGSSSSSSSNAAPPPPPPPRRHRHMSKEDALALLQFHFGGARHRCGAAVARVAARAFPAAAAAGKPGACPAPGRVAASLCRAGSRWTWRRCCRRCAPRWAARRTRATRP
jgi:hypothetical protein